MREEQKNPSTISEERRSVDRISRLNSSEDRNSSSTLPRRFSYGYSLTPTTNSLTTLDTNQRCSKLQQKIPESANTSASTARKISRFLRPDFYDQPKETSTFDKEKKEREFETQKVLKEIRDKRIKNRISMRRERSLSREKSEDGEEKMIKCKDLVEALTAGRRSKDEEDAKLRDEEESQISRRFREDEDSPKSRDREDSSVRKLRSDEDSRYSRLRGDDESRRTKHEEDLKSKLGQNREEGFTSRFYRPKRENAQGDRLEAKTNEDSIIGGISGLKSPLNENKSTEQSLKSPLDQNKTSFELKSPMDENKTVGHPTAGLKSPLDENKTIGHSLFGLKSPLDENKAIGHPLYGLKSPVDESKTIRQASYGLKSPANENKTAGHPSFGLKSPLDENKTIGNPTYGFKSPPDDNISIKHSSSGLKSPLNENKIVGQPVSGINTNGNSDSAESKHSEESTNEDIKSRDTESLLKNVSDNIKNIESNVLSNSQRVGTVKKERVSKLIRPKSYPSENGGGRKSGQTSPTDDKLTEDKTEQESSGKSAGQTDTSAKIVGLVKKGVKTKETGDSITGKLKENGDSSIGKLKENCDSSIGRLKEAADSSIGKLKEVGDSSASQLIGESSVGQVRKFRGLKDKTSSVDEETSEVKAVKRLSLPEGKFVEDVQQEKSKLVKLKSKISKSSKSSSESGSVKKASSSKLPEKSEQTAEKSVLISDKGKTTSDINLNSKIISNSTTTSDTNLNSKTPSNSTSSKYLKTSQSMDLNSEKSTLCENMTTESTSNKSLSSKSSSSERTSIGGKNSPAANSDLTSSASTDLLNGNYIPNSSAKSPVSDANENIGKTSKKADFFKTVYSELNSARKDLKTKKSQIDDGKTKVINPTDEAKSTEDKNGNSTLKSAARKSSNSTNANIDADSVKMNIQNSSEDEVGSSKSKLKLKLKKSTTQPAQSTTGKNKFLQSIEKKIEKLRSFNAEEKTAKPGGVETTIKRLREQSVPRNTDPITESTLIKRAVSVEDFSNVKSKALQPSRKSVTKILGLFKKYEDKSPKSPENIDPITMLQNIRESNIPMVRGKEKERPKSLQVNKVSKLPLNAHRKSLSLEGREEVSLDRNDEVYTRRNSLGLEEKEDVNSHSNSLGLEGREDGNSERKSLGLEGKDDVKSSNLEGREDVGSQRKISSLEGREDMRKNEKEDTRRNSNLENVSHRKLLERREDSLLQRRSVSMEGREDVKSKRRGLEEREEAIQQRRSLISPENNYQAHRKRAENAQTQKSSEESHKKLEDRNNFEELNLQKNSEELNGERRPRKSFSANSEYEDENQRRSYEERNNSSQRKICSNSEETRTTYGKTYAQRKTSNSSNNNENDKKTERKNLKLDFSSSAQDLNLNRISYATNDNSTLLSPFDETTSCDSWSVCSDFQHTQDLSSPLSPNGNTYSGDENDSVIDRIRRKSFYTRFNEKPKPKSRRSLIGNYKDLDLYKDYKEKSLPRYKDYSGSRRSSGHLTSSGEIESEYRPYVRSKSVSGGGDYSGGIPHRYQTYNPRRSNMSSLYGHEDGITEDLNSTGVYKKYTSRLGSLSRASRSPSSDFQYIPHSHATSSSSSHQHHHHQTTENGHTEHAV